MLEPFPPERVGNRRRLRLGLGTGPVAVAAKLEQLGLSAVEPGRAQELADAINEIARRRKTGVSDDEFAALVQAQSSTVRLTASTPRTTEGR